MAPVRTVQTTLTGCCEYTLDPFCASYRDFQLRAEDELAKFLYHALNNAWGESQNFEYKRVRFKKSEQRKKFNMLMSLEEAQKESALDLRWQLNHLLYDTNRQEFFDVYETGADEPMPNQNKMTSLLEDIREKANDLAHKQHLHDEKDEQWRRQDDIKSLSRMSEIILKLLDKMIELVNMIYTMTKHVRKIEPVSECVCVSIFY